jgi:hypothetical protein
VLWCLMSTSSYAVQPPATNSDEQRRLRRDNRLELKDLSKLFRFGLRVSAPRYPMMYLFVSLAGGGLGSFCIFSFVTQSLVVGSIMGAFMALGGFIEISYPDFSQGVFLEMLLSYAYSNAQTPYTSDKAVPLLSFLAEGHERLPRARKPASSVSW